MIIKNKNPNTTQSFVPFDLSITFENEQEAYMLFVLFNFSPFIDDPTFNSTIKGFIPAQIAEDMRETIEESFRETNPALVFKYEKIQQRIQDIVREYRNDCKSAN